VRGLRELVERDVVVDSVGTTVDPVVQIGVGAEDTSVGSRGALSNVLAGTCV
jgi:hypothetical protein